MILVENLPVPFDRRVWQEALALQSEGYRVHIVSPSSPQFRTRHEILDGITVHRYPPVLEAKNFPGFVLEYGVAIVSMMTIVANIARRERIDVIQACNPPDLLFLVGLPFVLLGRTRFIFDHHDACPELAEAKGRAPGSIAVRLCHLLERYTFRLASTSIATNESYKQIAIDRGRMLPSNVFVVRSGPSIERFAHAQPSRRLHFGHDYLVAYVGVMGIQDGVDYLIDAADHLVRVLGRSDVQFTLAGSGTEFERLKERVRHLGLANHVRLLGRVPEDELGELLASADVCINPDKYDRMNDISTMNKIMDYMALSKPIVQFDLTEGHVSAGDASLYVKRNDATALAQGIAELLEDESRRKHMGEVGRERLEGGLAWEHQIPNLIAAYAETLAKDNPAKLRVALISPPFEQSGGIGRLMGYLVEAIDDSKIELVVIDSRGGWINPLFSLVTLFRATAALMHLRLTRPPDVVHINLSDGGSTIRKCWLILVSKALGFPTVVHLHAGTYPEFFGSLPALGKGLVRSILRQCDAFLTLGTHWQKFAISELGLVPERVHVVRYGVPGPDPDRFRHRAKLRSAEPLRVVFLGRLGELKGTPQLLQALAVLAERGVEWTATLAGDGDVEATRAAAVRLGINDRVELPGWVTTAKTEELLEGANVLALPSFVEGLPVSVLEGLAHGLAVVTTPVGALLDILVDRENSFLVTPGDVTGLADALELLARDQQFRERLGECARRTWQDQLSMESCAPKLVQAWERAIA